MVSPPNESFQHHVDLSDLTHAQIRNLTDAIRNNVEVPELGLTAEDLENGRRGALAKMLVRYAHNTFETEVHKGSPVSLERGQ